MGLTRNRTTSCPQSPNTSKGASAPGACRVSALASSAILLLKAGMVEGDVAKTDDGVDKCTIPRTWGKIRRIIEGMVN
jgi:hypothetical protein